MGIDIVGLNSLMLSFPYVKDRQRMLTLGRQQIYMGSHIFADIMQNHIVSALSTYNYNDYCESFFKGIGFGSVDSMDNSSYEGASIIHNLNMPISLELKGRYGYIFDGGTSEHVFNIPQVYENIIDLLQVGGIVCSVVPNNNFSGHGMYQFSPEFFLSVFKPKYGMQLLGLYIGRKNMNHNEWINVNDVHHSTGGRNCSRFYDNEEVYIISIAKKTSDERCSLVIDPPNQYSYEEIVWRNTKEIPKT